MKIAFIKPFGGNTEYNDTKGSKRFRKLLFNNKMRASHSQYTTEVKFRSVLHGLLQEREWAELGRGSFAPNTSSTVFEM